MARSVPVARRFTGLSFDAGGNFLVAGGRDSGLPRAAAVAKVWDLHPVGPDNQVEHEAIGLVRHLASQQLKLQEGEQRIHSDPSDQYRRPSTSPHTLGRKLAASLEIFHRSPARGMIPAISQSRNRAVGGDGMSVGWGR